MLRTVQLLGSRHLVQMKNDKRKVNFLTEPFIFGFHRDGDDTHRPQQHAAKFEQLRLQGAPE